ncbi:MAG: hypothetical protein ACR2NP_06955 [Pirellulaceae bacterium]
MTSELRVLVLSATMTLAVVAVFALSFIRAKHESPAFQPIIALANEHDEHSETPKLSLKEIEFRFQNIQPTMGEADVLETLGLDNFSKYLALHQDFMFSGSGTYHKTYTLGKGGHRLEFRQFFGTTDCILHLPKKENAMTTRIGQNVCDMAGFNEHMNRMLSVDR